MLFNLCFKSAELIANSHGCFVHSYADMPCTSFEAKAKNTKNPRPRTQAQVFSKKQKKVFKNFFWAISKRKKGLHKFSAVFMWSNATLTFLKIVLSSAEDRAIFEDLRPRPRTSECVLEDSISS